jgi:hypothetical protein
MVKWLNCDKQRAESPGEILCYAEFHGAGMGGREFIPIAIGTEFKVSG